MILDSPTIAGKLLAAAAAESLRRFEFGVIPLFVLMGLLVSVSGIGKETYDVANHLFRKVRAGLGIATVAANAVFAAVTGSSIASATLPLTIQLVIVITPLLLMPAPSLATLSATTLSRSVNVQE